MVSLRRTLLPRYLLLSTALALLLFISSFWLPQGDQRDCGSVWQPCLNYYSQTLQKKKESEVRSLQDEERSIKHGENLYKSEHVESSSYVGGKAVGGVRNSMEEKLYKLLPLAPPFLDEWAESDEAPPFIKECPGQTFQVRKLLQYLRSSLAEDGEDVLLEPYLLSWDQLLNFMESLGTMVSLFSQKVKEKTELIRELSLKHSLESKSAGSSGLQTPAVFLSKTGVYRSVRSMVEAELKAGVVNFSRRTDSGCRTLLRLHRSMLWLKMMLEGLSEGPDSQGRFKSPGELSRNAYKVALAPHHPWMLRQAAEFVFLALPDREYFLQLVCVQKQEEATPVLRVIIHALSAVHTRTQRLLEKYNMLELP